MFNDKYGLTDAVLQGRKTMTRRIIPHDLIIEKDTKYINLYPYKSSDIMRKSAYKIGEIVAISQSYTELNAQYLLLDDAKHTLANSKGWNNKMFVKASLMPHQIIITDVRIERLQDISVEDLEKEGVEVRRYDKGGIEYVFYHPNPYRNGNWGYVHYYSLQDAGRAFFDSICGKGTWKSNPWVFVYDFKLIK
jgi:hypothetical protein